MKKLLLFFMSIATPAFPFTMGDMYTNVKTAVPYLMLAGGTSWQGYQGLTARSRIEKYGKKIEHEKMVQFMRQECSHIIDTPVSFYIGKGSDFGLYYADEKRTLAVAIGHDAILIGPEYYDVVEPLFNKSELSDQEERTLDIFRFILQHEAGHLKHNDMKKRAILAFILAGTNVALFELSKKLYSFTGSELLTVLGLNSMHSLISLTVNRTQEYAADNSVCTERAIAGGKQLFANIINLKATNPEIYVSEKLSLTHPTSEDRLKNLEVRCGAQESVAQA